MRFSKDVQPEHKGRPKKEDKKIPMCVSVKPTTKEYFRSHNVKGGDVLDEYVEKEK